MFELADRLVGIYKTHNCTKSATINPESFLNNCALANPYQNKVSACCMLKMLKKDMGMAATLFRV
jgi:hypothetical protein